MPNQARGEAKADCEVLATPTDRGQHNSTEQDRKQPSLMGLDRDQNQGEQILPIQVEDEKSITTE